MNKYGKTFTNETNEKQSTTNVSVGDMLTISSSMHDSFVNSFRGVPLRVDSFLEGNRWYCAVSQKLFNEIKEKYAIKKG